MLGKIILDLPPSPGNPRNSEGAMLRLNDGSILFIYSRFCGSDAADDAAADLYALISDDEGEHFHSLGPVVFHAETSAKNVMSVSLLRMENGDIGLFYLERRGETDMRMMLRRSADEGRTWTDPAICMPNSGYYVVNNDRVLRLCSGRILLPAALHRLSLRDDGSTRFDSRAAIVERDGVVHGQQGAVGQTFYGKRGHGARKGGRRGGRPGFAAIQRKGFILTAQVCARPGPEHARFQFHNPRLLQAGLARPGGGQRAFSRAFAPGAAVVV